MMSSGTSGTGDGQVRIVDVAGRPVIDYLTKDYAGFRQAMLDLVARRLPEWTDLDENDFGVVLIEAFAYVADILSYYQDRIANEAFLSTATQRRSVAELLALIGYQIDPGLSAVTTLHLHLDGTADVTVGAEDRVAVATKEGDVVFEVNGGPYQLHPQNSAVPLRPPAGSGTGPVVLPAGLTEIPVAPGHQLAKGQVAYVESLDAGGTRARSVLLTVTDVSGTGDVVTVVPGLDRAFAVEGGRLLGNNVPASHGRTVADEPLMISDGSPRQRLTLTRGPVSHLLVTTVGVGARAGSSSGSEQVAGPGTERRSRPVMDVWVGADARGDGGELWQLVDSLAASGPTDLHYAVRIDDRDRLTIVFGDGRRGAIPPGESCIRVRYRVGLGAGGNLGPDRLTEVVAAPAGAALKPTQPWAARGGADRESIEEAKISGPAAVVAQERAVTLADYVRLAVGFPGIGKASSRIGLRGGYKVVQVHVVPQDSGRLGSAPDDGNLQTVKDELRRYLEDRMPLNRMAGVEVLDAVRVPIGVTVEVHGRPGVDQDALAATVRAGLVELLGYANRRLGQPVRVGEIYAALYPIPGIAWVLLRELYRVDDLEPTGSATGQGLADLILADDELAVPDPDRLTVIPMGGS